jgi:hypothetical protein
MDTRELITYNPSKDQLEFNVIAINMVPELKELLKHRRISPLTPKDDLEEDIKYFEFKMLWWIAHPASPGFLSGLHVDEILKEARARFAPTAWRKSDRFMSALRAYEELLELGNPVYSLLKSHVSAIAMANKVVKKSIAGLNAFVDAIDLNTTERESVYEIENARKLINGFLKDGKDLSAHMMNLKEIKAKYNQEEVLIKELRGGKPYLKSMDPDNDIESF